ncbi:MurR/RpiR family transcriptional regulator [Sporosarcina sp. HYO08]|uniref:MurR/RpiR family transcriptional regulator n=1 Tax=Sporosarcina sp. HYO08 TaxID=1759557 RepID=UPI000797A727|nr:MurR/RpiR family transcriptional regulator [Sporosarcina sp. HYO08]KXH81835.1 transcriptional regulator [Sporosarcina sp. HYO08]
MKLLDLVHEHFNNLSKSQKKVATYVLDHPRNVAMSSAQEIGMEIGVSETTVIRFCYRIGLSGYAELQKTIREQLLFRESSLYTYQQTKLELEKESPFYEQVMEQDCRTITETIKQINERDYEKAIDALSKAETVYILGLRSSHAAATWLSYTLGLVRHDVRLIRIEAEDVIRTLSTMTDKSVLIAISFHRYLKETIRIAELAREQNAYVIAITDSLLSPIHAHSDVLFPIYSPNKSTLDATASLFSFMNAIVAGLSVKEKEQFDQSQRSYQSLKSDFLFVKGAEKR